MPSVMADEANPPSPSGPGEGRRNHGHQPARHVGGRRSSRQSVQGPIPHTDLCAIHPCRVEPLLVELPQTWRRKKRSTSAPVTGSPLRRRHQPLKSADVTTMVAVVVIVGIAAGGFLLLGKEQLAKPLPPSLWSVPPSSP